MKKNEIRNALEQELRNVQLSDRMKRDILYNARQSKKSVQKPHVYRYVFAAAAVILLMGTSLLFRGTQVFPDTRYEHPRPLTQNSTPVAAVENTPTMLPQEPTEEPYTEPLPVHAVGETMWTTENGRYYHLVQDCSGMKNTIEISRSEATVLGKQPCPACIAFVTPTPKEASATPEPEEMPFSEAISTLEPAPMYYGLENSLFFHTDEHCSGMENASLLTDLTGMLPCTNCVGYFASYYGTEHGTYYHLDAHCSGMENAFILGDLSDKRPCPVCVAFVTLTPAPMPISATPEPTPTPRPTSIAPESVPQPTPVPASLFCGTEHGMFYHITQNCSGMENAQWLTDLSGKQPCPVCIGSASFPTAPEDEAAQYIEINLTRYSMEDGCAMELEYISDPQFSLIDALPDLEDWYVDEADQSTFDLNAYLSGRISGDHIAQVEAAYMENGQAGFEIRDVTIILDGVNTEFSIDSRDVPSGNEYRFDGTENPSDECILYFLDRMYEGETAEVTIAQRLQQWYFDGENVYRRNVPDSTLTYTVSVEIEAGGKAACMTEPLSGFYFNADISGITLNDMHYVLVENGEELDLSPSAIVRADGSAFEADMVIDPAMHRNKAVGWRYPIERAEEIEKLLISDGEKTIEFYHDFEENTVPEKLRLLLASCGVTDPDTVDRTVESLIVIGENGDILAVSGQLVLKKLLETGLSEKEITDGEMVEAVISILSETTTGK